MRPVFPQGRAELGLVFHNASVVEASHLKAKGLTTAACAKFQNSKTHVCKFDIIRAKTASG